MGELDHISDIRRGIESARKRQYQSSDREKIDMGKIFNPQKYGILRCPDCKGEGKFPKGPDGSIVCSRCGGNGFIKKEKRPPEEDKKPPEEDKK